MRVGRIGVLVLLAVVACSSSSSCGAPSAGTEARVRSALDVLAEVIDPASRLAADACLARQEASAAAAEAGRITADEAAADVARVRARCHALRGTFAELRQLHDEAVDLVERGAVAEAERRVDELRGVWRTLERHDDAAPIDVAAAAADAGGAL